MGGGWWAVGGGQSYGIVQQLQYSTAQYHALRTTHYTGCYLSTCTSQLRQSLLVVWSVRGGCIAAGGLGFGVSCANSDPRPPTPDPRRYRIESRLA